MRDDVFPSYYISLLMPLLHEISTGKPEGINNKIKTMKRQAYGYRDEKFFELKILSLHDKTYAFVG